MTAALAENTGEEVRLLKAAYVYNFGIFTRWPDGTWQTADEPLALCTVGQDDLIDSLTRLGGKKLQGRTMRILQLENAHAPGECQILYVAASERYRYHDLIELVRGFPVLTVSELPGFGHSGGMIEVFHDQDRVRFMINQDAALKAGLRISSRLLSLAVVIGQESP